MRKLKEHYCHNPDQPKFMTGGSSKSSGHGGQGSKTMWYFQASAKRTAVFKLETIAKEREITRAQLVREILEDYAENN